MKRLRLLLYLFMVMGPLLLQAAAPVRVIFNGDSIVWGAVLYVTNGPNYDPLYDPTNRMELYFPLLSWAQSQGTFSCTNVAVSGAALDDTGTFGSELNTWWPGPPPSANNGSGTGNALTNAFPSSDNYIYLMAGMNDLQNNGGTYKTNGATGSYLYDDDVVGWVSLMTNLWLSCRQHGDHMIGCTLYPKQPSPETWGVHPYWPTRTINQYSNINFLIRQYAAAALCDYFADNDKLILVAWTNWVNNGSPAGQNPYAADGVHLSGLGERLMSSNLNYVLENTHTLYVDCLATNSANTGTSWSNAWTSMMYLREESNNVPAGSTVLISGGDYLTTNEWTAYDNVNLCCGLTNQVTTYRHASSPMETNPVVTIHATLGLKGYTTLDGSASAGYSGNIGLNTFNVPLVTNNTAIILDSRDEDHRDLAYHAAVIARDANPLIIQWVGIRGWLTDQSVTNWVVGGVTNYADPSYMDNNTHALNKAKITTSSDYAHVEVAYCWMLDYPRAFALGTLNTDRFADINIHHCFLEGNYWGTPYDDSYGPSIDFHHNMVRNRFPSVYWHSEADAFQLQAGSMSFSRNHHNIFEPVDNDFAPLAISQDLTNWFWYCNLIQPRSITNHYLPVLYTDGAMVTNGDTVSIGILPASAKVYTFKDSLTTEGDVLIASGSTTPSVNANATLVNLLNAINHTGTPDVDYKCAAAHSQVSAESAGRNGSVIIRPAVATTRPEDYIATLSCPSGSENIHLLWVKPTIGVGKVSFESQEPHKTATTADFTVPAVGSTVQVTVVNSSGLNTAITNITIGSLPFVLVSTNNLTNITVKNYVADNVGTVVSEGELVANIALTEAPLSVGGVVNVNNTIIMSPLYLSLSEWWAMRSARRPDVYGVSANPRLCSIPDSGFTIQNNLYYGCPSIAYSLNGVLPSLQTNIWIFDTNSIVFDYNFEYTTNSASVWMRWVSYDDTVQIYLTNAATFSAALGYSNNVTAPVLFADEANKDYRPISPSVIMGTNLTSLTNLMPDIDKDIYGNQRPVTGPWTAGAIEYGVVTPVDNVTNGLVLWLQFDRSDMWTNGGYIPDHSGYSNNAYIFDPPEWYAAHSVHTAPTFANGPMGMAAGNFFINYEGTDGFSSDQNTYSFGTYAGITNFNGGWQTLTQATWCGWAVVSTNTGGTSLASFGFLDSGLDNSNWCFGTWYSGQPSLLLFDQDGNATPHYHAAEFPLPSAPYAYHHYAVTWDGSTFIGYLDGAAYCTNTTAEFPVLCSTNTNFKWVAVGVLSHGGGTPDRVDSDGYPNNGQMNGPMADLRLFKRALSAGEIAAIYAQTNYVAPEPPVTDTTNIWLTQTAAGSTNALPGTQAAPFLVGGPESYTAVLQTNHPNKKFHYTAGTYQLLGDGVSATATLYNGCQHLGAGPGQTIIQQAPSPTNSSGYLLHGSCSSVEIRDLTIDCNASNLVNWATSARGLAMQVSGSAITVSNVWFREMGAMSGEQFPCYITAGTNVTFDACVIVDAGAMLPCGGPVFTLRNMSGLANPNLVIKNCAATNVPYPGKPFFAPTITNCTVVDSGVVEYLESGNSNEYLTDFLIISNRFYGITNVVKIAYPNVANSFIKSLTVSGNYAKMACYSDYVATDTVNSTGHVNSVSFTYNTVEEAPGCEVGTSGGMDFEYMNNVVCTGNRLALPSSQHPLWVNLTNTLSRCFTLNVDGSGTALTVMDQDSNVLTETQASNGCGGGGGVAATVFGWTVRTNAP